jgi:glycosyltransferase involved in cell wall biosynthesis
MKILMLGWEFPPQVSGGLGTACQGLVRSLTKSGVEILFVLPREPGSLSGGAGSIPGCERVVLFRDARPAPQGPGLLWSVGPRSAAARSLRVLEIESHLRPYASDPSGRSALYGPDLFAEVDRYARTVAELARFEEFDLVHAHDWMTFPAGLCAQAVSRRPLVCHVHSCEFDRSTGNGDPRIRAIEQAGFDGASRIVSVSRHTARILRARYRIAGAVDVVHNGVEPPAGRPRARREPLVLFVGRLCAQKGPHAFLEAASVVSRAEPRARFALCGNGELREELVARTRSLGLSDRVRFAGFLDREQLARMYARASVLAMPSVSEPFGLAALEALAHGVPAIVSRQSGAGEVLQSCLRVDYWNVEELARRILDILHRPALRARLATAGRAEARRMSWEASSAGLLRVYRELAA